MKRSMNTFFRSMLCLFMVCLSLAACSDTSKPPFIKAQVIDVYNNKTDIYNAHFHYQWQERGETAFLNSHASISRELMATIFSKRLPGQADVSSTLRIHLMNISKIEWVLTATGKEMLVYPTRGSVVETKCLFPQELRIDPASGLADYSCSIIGSKNKHSRTFDFSQDLDFLKSIIITGVDNAE
jgi:hypothetical protein